MADLQYVLEVEPLDLGANVKAVGLDLVEIESREPAHGIDAAKLWAAALSITTCRRCGRSCIRLQQTTIVGRRLFWVLLKACRSRKECLLP